ncbi:MAG: hypothetical protein IRZ18_04555 [Clostridia bacterium]|nr:hypothetical protein [Clostridia bacterium]
MSEVDKGLPDGGDGAPAARRGPTFDDPRCCASCVHVGVRRVGGQVRVYCRRLGYDTRPEWRFDCWTPKPHVRDRLDR